MASMNNICDIKEEFDDLDIKEEFIGDSNEFDLPTQKVEESSLPSTFIEPKWKCDVKVEDERASSLKDPLFADLDIKEEYEELDIKREVPEDPDDGLDRGSTAKETSHSSIESDMNSENKLDMMRNQAENNVRSINKKERRNPKRNCTKRNYTEDETLIESNLRDKEKEFDSMSYILNERQQKTTSKKSNIGLTRKSFKSDGKMKRQKDDQDKEESTSRNSNLEGQIEMKSFQCPQCNKKFTLAGTLKTHLRIHSRDKPFHCPQCDKRFIQSVHLTTHLRYHRGEKPFHCPQCDKKFTQSGHLKTHLRYHSGDRPFHCPQCDKKFMESSHLMTHLRIHNGDRPFHCPQCDKKFTRSNDLTRHLRIHSGERPFHCLQCDKKFTESSSLKKHLRIHSGDRPFHCHQCDKKFMKSSHLKTHLRIHNGDRPFHCLQCDKKFARSNDLTRHLRIHSGEWPFHCLQCDKKFTESSSLNKHLRIHSGALGYFTSNH